MSSWKKDLTMARNVEPQPWMLAPETQQVLDVLERKALFVGGCVRDTVLNQEVGDIDLATPLRPDDVMARLQKAKIQILDMGLAHGTVTAVVNKKPFEITTLRKDIETDGRHAVVGFTDDWVEDAQRRDFTMNTLLADDAGAVYDPTGRGLEDLQAGRVVFVGDAVQRIEEDYLRILRFFRFHAYYGRGQPDKDGFEACRAAAPFIFTLSHERISQEFFKILNAASASSAIDLMARARVMEYFDIPDFLTHDPELLPNLCAFQKHYNLPSLTPRLFVLIGMDPENIHKLDTLLIVPKVFKKEMVTLAHILSLPDLDNENAIHLSLFKHGRAMTAQGVMLELSLKRMKESKVAAVLELVNTWPIPEFPMHGKDIIEMGVPEGPNVGRILEKIQEWWMAEDFLPARTECLKRARTYLKQIKSL